MAKLEMTDFCLTPETILTLNYSGPDPWGVAKKIAGTIKPFFHVSSSGTSQSQLSWDVSGDSIKFYSVWWVKKKFSRFSTMKVNIKIQGSKDKKTNKGNFWMELEGLLETKFEGGGIFLKALWNLYSYIFYNRQRADYIQACREFLLGFFNEIKEHYNLKVTPTPALRGSMG